ncbi:hypothetical protein [uncultured Acetatifactor sp.]|jgi:hypothetical protein|uniref:hypothetical protein n=1 Tax=uncultured Acetatifactor sp. TaxID=1671927 RepID=UPI002636F5A5|nr:hypothetical protein [uncultured Acetatifactor sp.]
MGNTKREFIIEDLMVQDFIVHEGSEMLLEEAEETGRSQLQVKLVSDDNLCIANMDKKKTDFLFFQEGKTKSMYKRVDHLYCLTISPAVKPDCITLTGSIA